MLVLPVVKRNYNSSKTTTVATTKGTTKPTKEEENKKKKEMAKTATTKATATTTPTTSIATTATTTTTTTTTATTKTTTMTTTTATKTTTTTATKTTTTTATTTTTTTTSKRCVCNGIVKARNLRAQVFSIPDSAFDSSEDICFRESCITARGDAKEYKRGGMKYGLPAGWVRLGIKVNEAKAQENDEWNWPVSFHGTSKENVMDIFKAGWQLLKPGDVALGERTLDIKSGHISAPFERQNEHEGTKELFDPRQIFTSPSIIYSSSPVYAPSWSLPCGGKVQFALQLRQRPHSFRVGQQTIKARSRIDPLFENSEVEYYTKENVGIMVYGLLIKFLHVCGTASCGVCW
eukprot:g29202.t1